MFTDSTETSEQESPFFERRLAPPATFQTGSCARGNLSRDWLILGHSPLEKNALVLARITPEGEIDYKEYPEGNFLAENEGLNEGVYHTYHTPGVG